MQLNKPSIPGAVVGLIDQQQKRPNFILVVLKILICQHIAEIILFHGFKCWLIRSTFNLITATSSALLMAR